MSAAIPEKLKISIGEILLVALLSVCGILLQQNLNVVNDIRKDQVKAQLETNERDDTIEAHSKTRDAAIWAYLVTHVGEVNAIEMLEEVKQLRITTNKLEAIIDRKKKVKGGMNYER